MAGESRQGKMKQGWVKQATQVPKSLGDKFKEAASIQGGGGVKMLSTVALAIVTEMPDDYRKALVRYTAQKTVFSPEELEPKDLWEFLRHMIAKDLYGTDEIKRADWYIDRILDPELTPEPGKKASDKSGRRARAEGE